MSQAATAAWSKRRNAASSGRYAAAAKSAPKPGPTAKANAASSARYAGVAKAETRWAMSSDEFSEAKQQDAIALRFLSSIGWKPGDKIDVSNLQTSIDRIANDRRREGMIAANERTYRDVTTASRPNSAFNPPNKTRRYSYGADQPDPGETGEIRKALGLGYMEVIPKDWRAQMEKIEEKGSGASGYARNA